MHKGGNAMKKTSAILILLLLLMLGLPMYIIAGSGGVTYNANTGDTELNTTLGNLNLQTKGDNLSEFISNLSITYDIPKIKIEDLFFKVGMTPADVYMTVGLSSIADKPIDDVVDVYKANKDRGWGAIARQLGIKPGSKEFKALKRGGLDQLDKIKDKGKGKADEKSAKEKNPRKNK